MRKSLLIIAMAALLTAVTASRCMATDPMAPIHPSAFKAPVRIACIGDSITEGVGAGVVAETSWPAQLQGLLGASWQVGNFGVSGRTLLKQGDLPYWNDKAYQNALGFKPDVVIIMLGTNDTKPQNWKHGVEFVADYREFVKSFQALASKPRIYLCRPCPVPGAGNYGINEAGVKLEIARIDALAVEMTLGVIDMHAALADKPQMLPDNVHPNIDGHREMARAAFTVLTGRPPASQGPTVLSETLTPSVMVDTKTEPMAAGKFQPTWDSLKQYRTPGWFRDAKFGMTAVCMTKTSTRATNP